MFFCFYFCLTLSFAMVLGVSILVNVNPPEDGDRFDYRERYIWRLIRTRERDFADSDEYVLGSYL